MKKMCGRLCGGSEVYDSAEIGKVVADACLNQLFSQHGQNVATVAGCSNCVPAKAAVFYSKQLGQTQLSQTILVYPAPSPFIGRSVACLLAEKR